MFTDMVEERNLMNDLEEIGRELWRALGGTGDEEKAVAGWAGTVRALSGSKDIGEPTVQDLATREGYKLATGISVLGLCSCHMLPTKLTVSVAYSDRELTPELLIWTVGQLTSGLLTPFGMAEGIAQAVESIAPNVLIHVDGIIPCTEPLGESVQIKDSARRGAFCTDDKLRLEVWKAVLYRQW
jgi:hypothetical protein